MKHFRYFLIAAGLIGMLVFQNCANSKSEKVELSSNAGGNRLLYDKNGEICPMMKCQALDEDCSYVSSPVEQGACPLDCGTVVCKAPRICPMVMCAAPPAHCRYVATSDTNKYGCQYGCGNLVCDGDL